MGSSRAYPLRWYVGRFAIGDLALLQVEQTADSPLLQCNGIHNTTISPEQATAPLLNGILFATYHFLMKLQVQHANDTQDQQQNPRSAGSL